MRRSVQALLVAVILSAAGLIGWRVLAPAEVLATAESPYPAEIVRTPAVTGRLAKPPLIVDDRIRVYAGDRQLKADAPANTKTMMTAFWSYRRWPERLTGTVAVGTTVVSRWSDGALVALSAETGAITWRTSGPAAAAGSLIWNPPGLFTADGIVLVTGGGRAQAFDAATGTSRWSAAVTDCTFTTAGGTLICAGTGLDAATGTQVRLPAPPAVPLGCEAARSGCGGYRDTTGGSWLTTGPAPERAPGLDGADTVALVTRPTATGTQQSAFALTGGAAVTARSPLTAGANAWTWTAPAGQTVRVLGSAGGSVRALTSGGDLVVLAANDGRVVSRFRLGGVTERVDWVPTAWVVTPRFVVVERTEADGELFSTEPYIVAFVG